MVKLFKDCLTGKDNETYDIVRILLFLACIVYFTLSFVETFKGHDFNPIEYGTGLGLLFAGGGGGIALKQRAEPDDKDKS